MKFIRHNNINKEKNQKISSFHLRAIVSETNTFSQNILIFQIFFFFYLVGKVFGTQIIIII